jgi:hypothetical protein
MNNTNELFHYRGFKGVDFDGTLVKGGEGFNEPVMPMVNLVRKWLAEGEDVIIFTARGWQKNVEDFCVKYFGKPLVVTNVKQRGMSEWYDDRAIAVERNTGRILDTTALAEENAILRKQVEYLLNRCKKAGIRIRTKSGATV